MALCLGCRHGELMALKWDSNQTVTKLPFNRFPSHNKNPATLDRLRVCGGANERNRTADLRITSALVLIRFSDFA